MLGSHPQLSPDQHRFLPGEQPRSVNTPNGAAQTKLASEVSFSPVTTISVANGQTYVRPVKNTQSRPVSPTAVNRDGQVSIRGERVIELATSLHQQIRAKIDPGVNYKKETLSLPENPASQAGPTVKPPPLQPRIPTLTPEQVKVRSAQLKGQLEDINKALFEQIRQRITSEISLQVGQTKPLSGTVPKPPAFKQAKLIASAPVLTGNVSPQIPPPGTVVAKPTQIPTAVQPVSVLNHSAVNAAPTSPPKAVFTPTAPKLGLVNPEAATTITPTKNEVASHIENLEKEIELLTKEVIHIDQTITALEKEHGLNELNALEQKLTADEKMVQAVTEWRYSLNNLVNSHSIALKYLKQKTDWLEDKVENMQGHRAKHEKMHRKPREISFKVESLPKPTTITEVGVAQTKPETPEATKIGRLETSPEAGVVGNLNLTTRHLGTATEERPIIGGVSLVEGRENGTKPETNIVGNLNLVSKSQDTTGEAKPIVGSVTLVQPKEGAFQPTVPSLGSVSVIQEQTPKFVEKETLAERIIADKVQAMVKAALEKQSAHTVAQISNQPTSNQPVLPTNIAIVPNQGPKNEGAPTIELPANITIGQPKELPGKPPAQINILAIPVQSATKPNATVPTVTTGAALMSQADIERQILETAAREEAVKEAVSKAREEKTHKETVTDQEQINKVITTQPEGVTAESLKEDLTKLKSSLTTIDNKALGSLSKEERFQMMQHLENLERASEVSHQFDEIKGVAERRRVNAELQAMLERLGEKLKPTKEPTSALPQSVTPRTTVEALKAAEKKEHSPEDKARIIAEIKSLERERAAIKLEERSRPVVKAQRAYGKMLPNTPTTPNVINGIVKDIQGLLMDTVIIIVKDQSGDPVRAFKTNKIGQFAVSTPLPNGIYTLELEKQGCEFDIIEVDVNGEILPPIEIKAR